MQDRRVLRRPALLAARGSGFGSRASFDAVQSKSAREADVVLRVKYIKLVRYYLPLSCAEAPEVPLPFF